MKKIRCRLSYHFYRNDNMEVFAIGIRDGIYGNVTIFMTPPLTQIQLQLLIDNFLNTYSAYKNGGIAQKGPFNIAKEQLMAGFDTLSAYVDSIALGDANIILLAGFVPTKSSVSASTPPAQPQQVTITREVPGTFSTDCAVVEGADGYQALLSRELLPATININASGQIVDMDDSMPGGGSASPATSTLRFIIDLNKARKKTFSSLQIGTTYYVYYWAINAAGVSILSEPVSKKVLEA
jgi:hypothetical protein